ncbi:DUF6927 domain-containing protein [Streptosporangium sp. NPDC050855]|uniref:DUF6927 domain-containing protein n=1 Tax=Streptosporangium sp. NPDC050855 TaxID=3366194 RepID=UPI0037886527
MSASDITRISGRCWWHGERVRATRRKAGQMGSIGLHREPGMTDREFFEKEFPNMLGKYGQIVACASNPAGGDWNRAFYAAVTNNDDASYKPGETWALVVLMRNDRKSSGGCNFYYKDLDETMGPVESTCPDRILDLLSPTEHAGATRWRERCRAHNARLDKARKLTDGQIIRFTNPMPFGEPYGEAQRFRYRKAGRKSVLEAITDDGEFRFRARIPGWRAMSFEIENN